MSVALDKLVAAEHARDLRRAADRRRAGQDSWAAVHPATMELRLARAEEAQIVSRLAALDDAPELEGQALIALIDGVAVAALSLRDQRVVANPFVATGDVVMLLRLRGEHVLGLKPERRLLRRPRLGLPRAA
jgi:hypothetical protein